MARSRTWWLVVAALMALVTVGGYAFWQAWNHTEIQPWQQPAGEDGRVVHLTYSGSECRSGVRAEVDEQDRYVVITLWETVRAFSCSDVAVSYDVDVRLESPVDGRTIVDGSCGRQGLTELPSCPVIMAG